MPNMDNPLNNQLVGTQQNTAIPRQLEARMTFSPIISKFSRIEIMALLKWSNGFLSESQYFFQILSQDFTQK